MYQKVSQHILLRNLFCFGPTNATHPIFADEVCFVFFGQFLQLYFRCLMVRLAVKFGMGSFAAHAHALVNIALFIYNSVVEVIVMAENKPTFKNIVAYEKSVLNPIRYNMNYRIVPAYGILTLVVIIISCILIEIDQVRFMPYYIALLALLVLCSVVLVIYGQNVVKKEIQDEVARYDLNYTIIPDSDEYDFSNDIDRIFFTSNGMHINDRFYWYNHLQIGIICKTYMHRVIIYVGFLTEKEVFCTIPFDARSIKMLHQFHVPLKNPEVLEQLLRDTYAAFKRIYKKGKI